MQVEKVRELKYLMMEVHAPGDYIWRQSIWLLQIEVDSLNLEQKIKDSDIK